jgi:gamma-glutamyltranspeptidase / glutathione hydrolase
MMKYFILICLTLTLESSVWARPTFGKSGLVVSANDLASQAGIATLKRGGTAADAAVTTAFVLAVTRPYYGSLGGGGLMLTRFHNEVLALDHREKAPRNSTADMYLKGLKTASTVGGLAVAIPGNVRGLFELHKKFGKLSWHDDIQPAVFLAKNGFMVTEEIARVTKGSFNDFSPQGKKIFSNQGNPLQVGDTLKQPQLAAAFEIIQKKGADGFYKGPIADDIALTVKHEHGILDAQDLKSYEAQWMKPLKQDIFDAQIYSMPPPSSGGALIFSELKMAEALKVQNLKPYGHEEFHLLAEIMERAFFDRQYLADPKYTTIPVDEIYRDSRIQKWVKTINPNKKTSFDPKDFEMDKSGVAGKEGSNTTHYVVVDRWQNVVSATTTLNDNYGSGVVTEKFGITLNNEMDDFTTRPGEPNMFGLIQGKANAVAPGKTPLSSMTPTIIDKNGKFWMAVGSPGGPRIINAVFQVTLHALTTPFNLDQIVQAPRIHHQWKPDKLYFDPTLSPDTQEDLAKMGHILSEGLIARIYAIRVTPDGEYEGAFDARGEGGASGY